MHMHWCEIKYKLGTWRLSVLGMVRCKDYNFGTWRSSMLKLFDFKIVHWARQCRNMEIVHARAPVGRELSKYFRLWSCIYIWESSGYSEAYNFTVSYWITFHHILHSWWLNVLVGGWKVLDVCYLYLMKLDR